MSKDSKTEISDDSTPFFAYIFAAVIIIGVIALGLQMGGVI